MSDNPEAKIVKIFKAQGALRCRHELWVKSTIPTAHAELIEEELAISSRLKCDMVFRLRSPDPLWAEVGGLLADRDFIFEHYSDSISRDNMLGCVIKQASYARQKLRKGLSKGELTPCLVVTSHRFPRLMLKHSDFKNIGVPGIYTQGAGDQLLILIITSRLPTDSKYNFLRLLSRAPNFKELELVLSRLMKIRDLSKLERERLKETAMKLVSESDSAIRELAKRHVEIEMALEEKDRALSKKDQALSQKEQALSQKEQALSQKDQALSQKDQALSQAEEALKKAMLEIESLKRQLQAQ